MTFPEEEGERVDKEPYCRVSKVIIKIMSGGREGGAGRW